MSNFPITRNVGAGVTLLSLSDFHLTITTANGAVLVYLQAVSDLLNYKQNVTGNINFIDGIRFVDFSNMAATNNITFYAADGDTINGASSFTVNTNGATGMLIPCGGNQWMVPYVTSGGATVYTGNKSVQTLTDAATVVWNVTNGQNAVVTLAGDRTLSITNPVAGEYYTLRVVQGSGGNHSLTLPSPSKVVSGGAGAITLSTSAADVDILTVYYDGTTYWWTYGLNFT